ncbi:MAG: uL15 family ribosomal protein [Parcubacteria group bacterium]|nr:uL15 family ribosomal protein [Parcubacteria group bacterium]
MDLHNLQPKTSRRKEKRVGRGGKRGTTSGRGTKGQRARAGHRIRPAVRDLMMKIPKRRGFKFKSFKPGYVALGLAVLEKNFGGGEKVTPRTLQQKNLINLGKGVTPRLKILNGGRLTKRLILEGVAVSQSAAAKILSLGGEIRQPK